MRPVPDTEVHVRGKRGPGPCGLPGVRPGRHDRDARPGPPGPGVDLPRPRVRCPRAADLPWPPPAAARPGAPGQERPDLGRRRDRLGWRPGPGRRPHAGPGPAPRAVGQRPELPGPDSAARTGRRDARLPRPSRGRRQGRSRAAVALAADPPYRPETHFYPERTLVPPRR